VDVDGVTLTNGRALVDVDGEDEDNEDDDDDEEAADFDGPSLVNEESISRFYNKTQNRK